ncbi:MAG TPA: glycosyltransferase family 2 protein [Sphingomicrobium sp.]|nr:glycosyltransferase family 2 protein [Sphingomicrobium sp.]
MNLANACPRCTVIITVYNRAEMLGEALSSVAVSRLRDLEIIVVDDGSIDGSAQIAEDFGDPRVRIIRHDQNRGIPAARNSGLSAATGQYIAWLDSDDIARPDRFQVQADFLDANPEIAMIGGCAGRLSKSGRRKRGARVPMLDHEDIRAQLLFRSPFQQSSLMGRAEVLKAFPYRLSFPVCEDVDMFARLSPHHRVANLPRILVDRRLHPEQTIHLQSRHIRERKGEIFRVALASLGIDPSLDDLENHITLGNLKSVAVGPELLQWSEKWLIGLREANHRTAIYDPRALAFVSARIWLLAVRAALRSPEPSFAMKRLMRSSLSMGLANSHGLAWLRHSARVKLQV